MLLHSSEPSPALPLPQRYHPSPPIAHHPQSSDPSHRVTSQQQQQYSSMASGSSTAGERRTHPPAQTYSAMPPPFTLPSHPRTSNSKKRKLLSSPVHGHVSSPSFHSEEDEDDDAEGEDDYAPSSSTRPARRARKTGKADHPSAAGGVSTKGKGKGMSREALRKANHSLIERRRREKINAALDELRDMVPGLGDNGGKGGEFKLEVLEKTVIHMKDLKRQLVMLESQLGVSLPSHTTSSRSSSHQAETSAPELPSHKTSPYPSPSPDKSHAPISPDPNETEPESNLPPPLTRASSRPVQKNRSTSGDYLSSPLLNPTTKPPPQPTSRPPPPSTKSNPIFLPFPAPSPTSPFLQPYSHPPSYAHTDTSGLSTGTSATGSTGGMSGSEPSPFLAATGLSLFGGMVNVGESPADSFRAPSIVQGKSGSPPHLSLEPPSQSQSHSSSHSTLSTNSSTPIPSRPPSLSPLSSFQPPSTHAPNPNLSPPKGTSDMPAEEAANLLLTFSSPDTLRPVVDPQMPQVQGGGVGGGPLDGGRGRRNTVDDFSLDACGGGGGVMGQTVKALGAGAVKAGRQGGEVVGKSVRDILKLS
ncbi:hypothetical protein L198_02858 [Cryptococcus wingfieldii CBS 7118]|uniref:BHLH domain-containing protein n=1 Tax=Cryptococcus wingfieldii CBS 7118 TaxID=1295528 RepID=A0A1E3JI21_9TREE|nr:hypothetical protein L198_02858 [Cryptococcus wingfieldii CBS 7118]ODO00539.1 hypothetical protein L198_02858 [Cryptococcus wingfieldii CBS 7118]